MTEIKYITLGLIAIILCAYVGIGLDAVDIAFAIVCGVSLIIQLGILGCQKN